MTDDSIDTWKHGPLLCAVVTSLQERGVTFDLDEESTSVRFLVHLPRAAYRILLFVDEERELAVCHVYFPVKAPMELRMLACETISRANFGLMIGAFEMDFQDGEIRFRTGVDVEGGTLAPTMADSLVKVGLAMCERYYEAFMHVFFSGGSPEDAIAVADSL